MRRVRKSREGAGEEGDGVVSILHPIRDLNFNETHVLRFRFVLFSSQMKRTQVDDASQPMTTGSDE